MGDKLDADSVEAAERAAKIVELRREGKSFRAIAEIVDIHYTRVHQIFHTTLRELPSADLEGYRRSELERLYYLRERLQQIMDTVHYHVYEGQRTDVVNDAPVREAIAADIRISESIRKLTGADAPVRAEVTTTQVARYEVVGVDMDKL